MSSAVIVEYMPTKVIAAATFQDLVNLCGAFAPSSRDTMKPADKRLIFGNKMEHASETAYEVTIYLLHVSVSQDSERV